MTIEVVEAIKIIESYKKYASVETKQAIECMVRDFEFFMDEYSEKLVNQMEEK